MKAMLLMLPLLLSPPQELLDLEATTARLRDQGLAARVSVSEDPKGEITIDHDKEISLKQIQAVSGTKKLVAVRIFTDTLTDQHVRSLKDLPDLKLLVIMSTKLTDSCLKNISRFPKLEKLDVNKASITKAGLQNLKSAKSLRRLYLYNAKIAEADLNVLMDLDWLKVLALPAAVSRQTRDRIAKSLPGSEVTPPEN